MIPGQQGGQGRAGQGRDKAGFLELLAAAAQVGIGQARDGQGLVGGRAFAWWWRDPHPTEFTDPACVRLGVGADLSSYTWTFEGPPGGWLLLGSRDYSGSSNSKHSFSIYYEPSIVPST